MQITAIKTKKLLPPKDDLRSALRASRLSLKEGDIVAVSSKVVSIHEGRCVPLGDAKEKEKLALKEADWYFPRPRTGRHRRLFTITRGALIGTSGIDESNADGHFVLYPIDPMRSAAKLRTWLQKEYGVKNVGIIITDSRPEFLRSGAIGFALAWSGFAPLKDYRGSPDLFGRLLRFELANVADALASAAVFVMGEGNEGTPIALIRGAKVTFEEQPKKDAKAFVMTPKEDWFSPMLKLKNLKKGGWKG